MKVLSIILFCVISAYGLIPPPPRCEYVPCPKGYECNPISKICYPKIITTPIPPTTPKPIIYCQKYKPYCPKGYECDFYNNKCNPIFTTTTLNPYSCRPFKYCPPGYKCNPLTLKCYPITTPIPPTTPKPIIYCSKYKPYCPKGYECVFYIGKCYPIITTKIPLYSCKYNLCPKGYYCNTQTYICYKIYI